MLKKLAKYGKSTALVIDKAILELLNVNESSMVKLQTDGRSLIHNNTCKREALLWTFRKGGYCNESS